MIERYVPSEIGAIWTDEEKFARFLRIERLLCEALEHYKQIPKGTASAFDAVAIRVADIKKIEQETQHDIVAFIKHISPQLGPAAQYLHKGMTSSDLLDTTLAWQIKDSTEIITKYLDDLIREIQKKALKYKDTLCMARTHGVHAELYSFGLKFLYVYADLAQERRLLTESLSYSACGKLSGAVGTFAYHQPRIEEFVCKKLGIGHALVSTQIVSRERIAYFLSLLALIAATLERFATEIRHLQRTEVDEAQEPFYEGQKGSSAMPHKQNPVICERVCGLARLVRANTQAAFENINLWHERDISHSSVERVIVPDSCAAVTYSLQKMIEVVKGLRVKPERMMRNIELNRGLVYSQKILTALMEKGLPRMEAYEIIQSIALAVINANGNFKDAASADARITKYVSSKELADIFNPYAYLCNVDSIYKRAGVL